MNGRRHAKLGDHAGHGDLQRAIDGATAGAFVTASAQLFGHGGDIDPALAAQTHPKSPVGQLAKECRHLDILDGKRIVDQAFTIFFPGPHPFHLFAGDRNPGQRTLAVKIGESCQPVVNVRVKPDPRALLVATIEATQLRRRSKPQ